MTTDEQPFEIKDERPQRKPTSAVDGPVILHEQTRGLTIAATIVSYVFHPLFLSLYSFLFINVCYPFLFAHLDRVARMRLIVVLVINTIIFPLITIVMIQRLGFSKTLHMVNRKERILPYIAMCAFSFWTFMVVRSLAIDDILTHVLLGTSFAIFLAFFLNNFYKISIHAVGAGSFVALALVLLLASDYNLFPVFLLVLLLAGIIGSSRLYLNSHVNRDVFTGYMVGMIAQLIAFRFF